MVTFLAAGHHRPLTGTKLYCLVTEAHVCEQLAQGRYLKVEILESNPLPFVSRAVTIKPRGHQAHSYSCYNYEVMIYYLKRN